MQPDEHCCVDIFHIHIGKDLCGNAKVLPVLKIKKYR